jgi:hypothetical protein
MRGDHRGVQVSRVSAPEELPARDPGVSPNAGSRPVGSVSIRKRVANEDPCGKSIPLNGRQDDPRGRTAEPRSEVRIQIPSTHVCRPKFCTASPKGLAQWDLYSPVVPELNHHVVPGTIEVSITICSRNLHAVTGWITRLAAIVPARCVHVSIVTLTRLDCLSPPGLGASDQR